MTCSRGMVVRRALRLPLLAVACLCLRGGETGILPPAQELYPGWSEERIVDYIRARYDEIMSRQRDLYAAFEARRDALRAEGDWPPEGSPATDAQAGRLCKELYFDWGSPEKNWDWQDQTIMHIQLCASPANRRQLRDCLLDYYYADGRPDDPELSVRLAWGIDDCADAMDEEAKYAAESLLDDGENVATLLQRPAQVRLAATVRRRMIERRARFQPKEESRGSAGSEVSSPAPSAEAENPGPDLDRLLRRLQERNVDVLPILREIGTVHAAHRTAAREDASRAAHTSLRIFHAYARVIRRAEGASDSVRSEIVGQLLEYARGGYVVRGTAGTAWMRCVSALGRNAGDELRQKLTELIASAEDGAWKRRLIDCQAAVAPSGP